MATERAAEGHHRGSMITRRRWRLPVDRLSGWLRIHQPHDDLTEGPAHRRLRFSGGF
jgi:hypothetical protein